MVLFDDPRGLATAAACFLLLWSNHCSRDALYTSLPAFIALGGPHARAPPSEVSLVPFGPLSHVRGGRQDSGPHAPLNVVGKSVGHFQRVKQDNGRVDVPIETRFDNALERFDLPEETSGFTRLQNTAEITNVTHFVTRERWETVVEEVRETENLKKEGPWRPVVQAVVLASYHFGAFFGLILGQASTEGTSLAPCRALALLTLPWAALSLVTPVTLLAPFQHIPIILIIIRVFQGLAQGTCYPYVYRVLQSRHVISRGALSLVFSGAWLGTACGVAIGSLPHDSVGVAYWLPGGIALVTSLGMLLLRPCSDNDQQVFVAWRHVFKRDVLVCVVTSTAVVWVLHTLLLAPTLLTPDSWGTLLMVTLLTCCSLHAMEFLAAKLIPDRNKPARAFLVSVNILGLCAMIVSLAVISSTEGVIRLGSKISANGIPAEITFGLVLGALLGCPMQMSGLRMVVEMAGVSRRSRALAAVNLGAAVGAIAAASLPGVAKTGLEEPPVELGALYKYGVTVPLLPVALAVTLLFLFLIFPQSEDINIVVERRREPSVYVVPRRPDAPPSHARTESADGRSFKSVALSTASFRTAQSRGRTVSFKTVYDGEETEVHTVEGSAASAECRSLVEGSEECKSLVDDGGEDSNSFDSIPSSTTSFHTVAGGERPSSLTLAPASPSYSSTLLHSPSTTSAWLRAFHHVEVGGDSTPSSTPHPNPPLPGLLF